MASILKVDDLRGNTAAGNITITSEGGAATQSLQQGLAKSWVRFTGTGTVAVSNSFNIASVTDAATGSYEPNFTNVMSDATYSATMLTNIPATAADNAYNIFSETTAKYQLQYYASATQADPNRCNSSVHGDMA